MVSWHPTLGTGEGVEPLLAVTREPHPGERVCMETAALELAAPVQAPQAATLPLGRCHVDMLAGPGLQDLGGFAPGLLRPRLPLEPPLTASPEVGICSFARFSGELLKVRPSALDPAGAQVVADDPETTLRDEGRTLCFSTLAMVQCCKVGLEDGCRGAAQWWEEMGARKGTSGRPGGAGELQGPDRTTRADSCWAVSSHLHCLVLPMTREIVHFSDTKSFA